MLKILEKKLVLTLLGNLIVEQLSIFFVHFAMKCEILHIFYLLLHLVVSFRYQRTCKCLQEFATASMSFALIFNANSIAFKMNL